MKFPGTGAVDLTGIFTTMLHLLSSRIHLRFTRGPVSLENKINLFARRELIFLHEH